MSTSNTRTKWQASVLLAFASAFCHAETSDFGESVWTSAPVAIDSSTSDRISPNPVVIAYDQAWYGAADGVTLRLEAASDTQGEPEYATVEVFSTAAGTYEWTVDTSAGYYRHLRLVAVASDSTTTVLESADLAIQMAQGESEATEIDTTANSFQRIADEHGTATIAYDSEWFGTQGGMKLLLGYVRRRSDLGLPEDSVEMAAYDAPVSGTYTIKLPFMYGDYTWTLTAVDANGQPISTPLQADYSCPQQGSFVLIR